MYGPIVYKSEVAMKKFYEMKRQALKHIQRRKVSIIMSDWNAKVGKRRVENIIGEYGLRERN